MTTDELEALLEAGAESPALDFKTSCPWNALSFAKDILAFSNLEDGGRIVIGVEDATFARHGISATHMATYDLDIMRDQISAYADPHVDFSVAFPTDRTGIIYAVIVVQPFDMVPVVCRRDSDQTRAGTIYFRSRSRRPESAPISNSTDLRGLIELAAIRMQRRWRQIGLRVHPGVDDALDRELGGL